MWAAILKRLGAFAFGGSGWVVYGVVAAVVFSAGAWTGHRLTAYSYLSAENKALEQAAAERKRLEGVIARRDQQLVEAQNEKRIEYRTVQKVVTAAVDPIECRITDDGVQATLDQIRSSNRRRGYDATLRPSP